MKRILVVIVLILGLGVAYPVVAADSAASDHIIRIHVLAHNDSSAEQEIKLHVRDAVLTFVAPLLSTAGSSEEASQIIEAHLQEIKMVALNQIFDRGASHQVQMQWGTFVFPTRIYGQEVFPAGKYTALNIHIGDGAGRNWWCVMYPPLCYVEGVVGQGQQVKYEFAILNWVRSLLRRLSS